MKIKKAKNIKVPAESGGAAIADRFRLDPVNNSAPVAGTVSRRAAMWAFIAGLISLAVVGILTFILYKHWEYLMPA